MAENNCDRFSNLPEELIHHIFSKFNYNEMNSMMNVSKKLQNLCFSSSTMAFGAYLHHPSSTALDFRDFVDEFLAKASFRLTNSTTPLLRSLCLTWRRGKDGRKLHCSQALPQSSLASCVETLVVNYYKIELLEASNFGEWISSSFPCVKKLVVRFEDCSFGTNQTLSIDHCPTLEEIEVSGPENSTYDHNLRLKIISCSSLEHLTIKNLRFEEATCEITIMGEQLRTLSIDGAMLLNCSSLAHVFKIHAPNLRVFHWRGSAIKYFVDSTNSFQHLEKAVLDVKGKHKLLYYKFVNKLLSSLQHAIHLEWRSTSKDYVFRELHFKVRRNHMVKIM